LTVTPIASAKFLLSISFSIVGELFGQKMGGASRNKLPFESKEYTQRGQVDTSPEKLEMLCVQPIFDLTANVGVFPYVDQMGGFYQFG
jgi:hypothetical protein